ncbi:tripartite tricarboxylate transporter substrate binding protein [Acidisphaera sp. S103]|uniref:Bug family tripartite tricarboxylate transporter substrate binding protein n=1 Tax=Acidisphaera sp. S103 TaxID=1747223 RepID=UPI00131A6EA7|nr:tripartite tricarboxylate transporter substrate-binding protein [Acidisphaera sp. S103]
MTVRRRGYPAGFRRLGCPAGLRRRDLLAGLSASTAATLAPMAAGADQPKRPITLLLGFSEGSVPDKAARDFVTFLAPHLPAFDIRPRYLPGEAGRTMLAALGAAAPDGATIGWVVTPTLAARIIDRGDPSLGECIRMIGEVEHEPIAFVSPSADPADSVQDIIRRAADDADAVPLGTPPAGSPPHLAAMRLQVLAQTQLNIVTFPSAAAARQAVLAGNVSAAALGLSAVIGDVRDADLTAIGIAAGRRFGLLPDAPILDEGGIPLAAFIRRGIAVPAGTPPELVAPLAEAMRAVVRDDAFRDQVEANGTYASWHDGPDWLKQMRTEQAELAKLWETNPWLSSSRG